MTTPATPPEESPVQDPLLTTTVVAALSCRRTMVGGDDKEQDASISRYDEGIYCTHGQRLVLLSGEWSYHRGVLFWHVPDLSQGRLENRRGRNSGAQRGVRQKDLWQF